MAGSAPDRRLHHRPPAEAVHVDERDAEARGARDRAGHGVRDVVELEVEEDLLAACHDLADELGAGGGEDLAAHLEEAHVAGQPLHEGAGGVRLRHVEGHDQAVAGVHAHPPGFSVPDASHGRGSPGYSSVPTTALTSSRPCRSRYARRPARTRS